MTASIATAIALPAYARDSGSENSLNTGAWQGVFAQKNILGVATAIAIAAALGLKPRSTVDKAWRFFLFLTSGICAYKSQSREAWIAISLLFMFATFMLLLRRVVPRSRPPIVIGALTSLAIIGYLINANLDAILGLLGRTRTASGRTDIWEASLLLISRKPWLGYGIYGLWGTSAAWDVVVRAGWQVTSSHSNYLEVLLSYGYVGMLVYLPIPLSSLLYMIRALLSYDLQNLEILIYVMVVILTLSFTIPLILYTPAIGFVLLIYSVSCLERVERSGFISMRER